MPAGGSIIKTVRYLSAGCSWTRCLLSYKMEILVSCDSTNAELDSSLVKRTKLSESIVEVKSIEVSNNPAPVPSSISVAKRTSNSVSKGQKAPKILSL